MCEVCLGLDVNCTCLECVDTKECCKHCFDTYMWDYDR